MGRRLMSEQKWMQDPTNPKRQRRVIAVHPTKGQIYEYRTKPKWLTDGGAGSNEAPDDSSDACTDETEADGEGEAGGDGTGESESGDGEGNGPEDRIAKLLGWAVISNFVYNQTKATKEYEKLLGQRF
jgi:hypothetical protein